MLFISSCFIRETPRLTPATLMYPIPATWDRARCYIKTSLQTGGSAKNQNRIPTRDDMRQVSNLLLATASLAVCLPLVKHLHRALLWLFNRRFFRSEFNEFLYSRLSPLTSYRPKAAFYYMNYELLSPRRLNILIFAAPLHSAIPASLLTLQISFHESTG